MSKKAKDGDKKKGKKGKGGEDGEVDPETDIPLLIECVKVDYEKYPDITPAKPIEEAARLLWNMCLVNPEEKRQEIFNAGAIPAIFFQLQHRNRDDVMLALIGLLSTLSKLPEAKRPIMKEFPVLTKIFKTSKKERLVDATSIVLGALAEDGTFQEHLCSIMKTILTKLGMEMTYTKDTYGNLLFVLRMLCDDEDIAAELYHGGGLPTVIDCLTDRDKAAYTHAAAIIESMMNSESLYDILPKQLLEMRIVPLLCDLLLPDKLEEDGFAAIAKILEHLAELEPEGEAVLTRIIEEKGVQKLINLLPDPEAIAELAKATKKKKKNKKPPPVSDITKKLHQGVTGVLTKITLNIDSIAQILDAQGIDRLQYLMEHGDDTTRVNCRTALWNLNFFQASGGIVDRFSLTADEMGLTLRARGITMTDRRTMQTSFRGLESRVGPRPASKTTKTLPPVKQNRDALRLYPLSSTEEYVVGDESGTFFITSGTEGDL
uniref:Uncharacterized protein n=1 Tax=Pyramimonas obovata TaxID=1411642 RepID=A0A7S0MVT1_9CHLO|mmetsp:Transcript_14704/g.31526  ORF Transcript_14704/g.31526 Transcript_14704/m.31526 type:complete len:489 (+) Transcript_14704:196-1662(+)|eukprot:CAMPEP_0118951012 /NCGR_PEP_ID=MMETSP1169-20130426/52368_1 /TAXON_ID=36882 /ORGANISM="Pyramimonas obovata, Strain CCMP722" /LENGTH=488 /DNA_ID=CAMNT_0006897975 /DNA_START=71 /DNA_END=1537 /DNA_ORIENTATION=-